MASAKVQITLTGLKPGALMLSYKLEDDLGHVLVENKQAVAVTEPIPETGPAEGSFEITLA